MDLKKTINNKIINLHGSTIDNYDLTGFKYDDASNQATNISSGTTKVVILLKKIRMKCF